MNKYPYLKIIEPLIKEAGQKALKKFHKFDRHSAILKGKQDLVTKVDLETEQFLMKNIKKNYPNHGFLAEESGKQDINSPYIWFIDPIDGTTNFSIHNPLWSISIGLAYEKDIIFGAIYFPFLDELFYANKNQGAFLNNKKLKLNSKLNSKKLIHTYCHGSDKKSKDKAIKYYTYQKQSSLDCRQLGSAAIELAYVAAGRIDSIVIPGAKAWDIAAGSLIAKEAGADVLDLQGKLWSLNSSDILACHPKTKKDILKVLKKI
jgi:myo-inositol-1(or 4)-monophosphatase